MTEYHDERHQYQRVAAELRAQIMSGEIPAGTQLPSTLELIRRYGAAPTTISRALASLKAEGYLVSRIGKGVYVRGQGPLAIRVDAYFEPSPGGWSTQLLHVGEVTPPRDVALAMGSADDEVGHARALLRHRLDLRGGAKTGLSRSYYPLGIADGTDLAARTKIRGGAPRALARLGYPQRYFTDRVSARMPTPEEARLLELPDDVPVLRQLRVIRSDHDVVVEVSILIKGAHLYELAYRETVGDTFGSP